MPSVRLITGWILRPGGKLDGADRLGLRTACQACLELAALTELAQGFTEMVHTRGGARVEEWINLATPSSFPQVRGFARGCTATSTRSRPD